MEASFSDVWAGLRRILSWCLLLDALVSSPVGAVSDHGVFGLFPLQDQVEQCLCLRLRTKAADLVGATAKLAEEALQQVRGADQALIRKGYP